MNAFSTSGNEPSVDFTFSKKERLTNKTTIQELFTKSSSFYIHPFRVRFLPQESEKGVQVLFTIPVRNMKRAVQRNWIKRRLREAYRLNKHPLLEKTRTEQKGIAVAFIYVEKKRLPYKELENKLILSLERLIENF